jgi:hypothetical protein
MLAGALGSILQALEQRLARLAQRRGSVIVLAGAISLAGRALLLPVLPVPKPAIQDEFSYLLAGDTFASGRLANPTPPFPEHFETLQVILHPAYASKYPPLSGLVMALGQKLTGQAWSGVWLSTAILAAALCWALQGWLSPVWALAGSLIALFRIGIVSYWTESYWGGTCAAIGGALLIGAVPRLVKRLSPGPASAYAAGLAILANTRPYEGLVLAVACSAWLLFALGKRRVEFGRLCRTVVLPMVLVLVPAGAWMSYYNYRVTGSPLEMPYMAHEKQYAVWSTWLWRNTPNPAPVYSNAFLRDFWTIAAGNENRSARQHWLKAHITDLITQGHFFLGWPLVLCLIGFARQLWRDPVARSGLLLLAAFYAGVAFDARLFPHYAAPATALVYILAASSLRAAKNSWPGSIAERRFVSWSIIGLFVLTTGLGLLQPENRYLFGPIDYHARGKRASVEERLKSEPGKHLVLVRYGPHHDRYEELVYNSADLDRSPVIWARSLGPDQDRRLVRYYANRQAWLLEEDGEVALSLYTTAQEKGTITSNLERPTARQFWVGSRGKR